ncbi:hypothetical protein [Rhizobium laguerreae]|uniref:hypothetical protein n=2 Tax=Rhizobium laguerreae TaxID=1076926 RepID=UPI0014417B25|nr:hypothetical protein [Rhizobium laguerreae]
MQLIAMGRNKAIAAEQIIFGDHVVEGAAKRGERLYQNADHPQRPPGSGHPKLILERQVISSGGHFYMVKNTYLLRLSLLLLSPIPIVLYFLYERTGPDFWIAVSYYTGYFGGFYVAALLLAAVISLLCSSRKVFFLAAYALVAMVMMLFVWQYRFSWMSDDAMFAFMSIGAEILIFLIGAHASCADKRDSTAR